MELSTLHELYHVLWRVCSCQSPCQCGYWHSESQIILFGSMANIIIFTGKCNLNK